MATRIPVQGPASYFPSIEKKYGKPIDHWMQVLDTAGPLKHMELVGHLKPAKAGIQGSLLPCRVQRPAASWPIQAGLAVARS